MSALVITRGLPGSGKTTFAREWAAHPVGNRVRVNRDDIRAMIHHEHYGRQTEDATTTMAHAAIRAALRNGQDVICDDTNLNAGNVKRLLKIAEQCGADVEFHDFPISVEDAIARDANRAANGGRSVGADVIEKMHLRYLAQHKGQMPPAPALTPRPTFKPYTPVPGTPRAVIVDIDGTLADNYGHRSPYDYSRVHEDAVHQPVLDLLWLLIGQGHTPIIMSGRDDACYEQTEAWLADRCGLAAEDYAGLIMRATGDKRDDAIVKLEMFDQHVREHYDVRYVLDDRNRVVRAWRSIGLTVLQVADGDF